MRGVGSVRRCFPDWSTPPQRLYSSVSRSRFWPMLRLCQRPPTVFFAAGGRRDSSHSATVNSLKLLPRPGRLTRFDIKRQSITSSIRMIPTESQTKEMFRRADAVCFDVDSTVIKEEGIDELAKFCGVGDAVTEMTRNAMGGSVTFKTALTERLAIIKASREQVNKLITDHPPQLTPGIRELVDQLQQRNIKVFLISGGFRCIVEHVASQLNIPANHVYANRLKFYFNGEYAGFDETQPTAESGGKGRVISMLKEQYGFKTVVMIGDGATDLEACPPASAFVGFGGNVIRPQVKEGSSWFVTSFGELMKELEKKI